VDVGNSRKGVALYRNADVLLKASKMEGRDHCFIIVCKVCSVKTYMKHAVIIFVMFSCFLLIRCFFPDFAIS